MMFRTTLFLGIAVLSGSLYLASMSAKLVDTIRADSIASEGTASASHEAGNLADGIDAAVAGDGGFLFGIQGEAVNDNQAHAFLIFSCVHSRPTVLLSSPAAVRPENLLFFAEISRTKGDYYFKFILQRFLVDDFIGLQGDGALDVFNITRAIGEPVFLVSGFPDSFKFHFNHPDEGVAAELKKCGFGASANSAGVSRIVDMEFPGGLSWGGHNYEGSK